MRAGDDLRQGACGRTERGAYGAWGLSTDKPAVVMLVAAAITYDVIEAVVALTAGTVASSTALWAVA